MPDEPIISSTIKNSLNLDTTKLEVAGELPQEIFNVHLKTSSNRPVDFVQDYSTPALLNKDGYLISDADDQLILTGVGVAEPVPETEFEIESRNRYSDIVAETNETLDEPVKVEPVRVEGVKEEQLREEPVRI